MTTHTKHTKKSKGKHIVFTINAIQFARYSYPLGKRLEEQGNKVTYVTYSKECIQFFRKRKANYSDIIKGMKQFTLDKPFLYYLDTFEKKYNIKSMNLVFLGDRNHTWMPQKKAAESLIRHFLYWERFLKEKQVDFILGGTERFINEVPRIVSKRFKTKHLVWKMPPIKNKFIVTEDHMGHWTSLDRYWKKNKHKSLTPTEEKKAKKFISNLVEKRKRSYLCFGKNNITLRDLWYFAKRLYVNAVIERGRNPYANLPRIGWELFKKVVRKRFVPRLYKKPPEGEKYIFYPLHLQVDAQIIVRAPQYVDQVALIENLAHFIPVGHKLYVKEHPNNVGGMPIRDLKRIKALPNVRLLPVNTHSHSLIENASAIITVNSTVGWEAMMYRKPVITLGTAFYDVSGLTHNVRDFYEISEIMKACIKEDQETDKKKKEKREQTLLRFVHAVLGNVYEGNIVTEGKYWDAYMQDENLQKVTNGILDALKKFN